MNDHDEIDPASVRPAHRRRRPSRKPAKLSDVTIASSDETVVVATYDPATKEIVVKAVSEGTASVVLSGDASVDEGLQGFEPSEDFTIQTGDVVSGTLTFDPAAEQ